MYGLPRTEINNAMARGYSAEALEHARQILVQLYYQSYFAWFCEDEETSGSVIDEEVVINGRRFKWLAIAFAGEFEDRDGAVLMEIDYDNNREIFLDLSHWELRHLWEDSLH
jgi:hypothetical protein